MYDCCVVIRITLSQLSYLAVSLSSPTCIRGYLYDKDQSRVFMILRKSIVTSLIESTANELVASGKDPHIWESQGCLSIPEPPPPSVGIYSWQLR